MEDRKPSYIVTRLFAIAAFIHFCSYSFTENPSDAVMKIDLFIILGWMIGRNGREMVVDAVKNWVGGK